MGVFAGNGHIILNAPVVNHRHHKQDYQLPELFSDTQDTSVYPEFHIPRKQVEKASPAQPKDFYKDDIANLCSIKHQMLLQLLAILHRETMITNLRVARHRQMHP